MKSFNFELEKLDFELEKLQLLQLLVVLVQSCSWVMAIEIVYSMLEKGALFVAP